VTSPAGRVLVACASCDVGLTLAVSPQVRLRQQLSEFFTEHDGCETMIDISGAPELRLAALPA
jgi:hypothetical protein